MKKLEQKDKYTFTFHLFDKSNEIVLTILLKTKKVTAKRAGEMLLESKKKYLAKKDKYVYSVERNGTIISAKSLKGLK